jgi:inositol-hexakisphosphate 5-kinase
MFRMCRYIGVLNVTFSKGPKPSKSASDEAQNVLAQSKVAPKGSEETATGGKKLDGPGENTDPSHVADNEQRIVSHSQEIGERPQVILEQNRHIVPFSLFDFAKRPRTTEHQQSNDHQQSKSHPSEAESNPLQLVTPSTKSFSPTRPLLSNSPSWGKTSVNNKFGEQILRDVFLPLPIHHHHHHKHTKTIPRLREPSSRRRGNFPADLTGRDRRTTSILADEARIPTPAEELNSSHEGNTDDQTPGISANTTPQNAYSISTSALEDLSHDLEKVETTNNIGSEGPQVSRSNNKIRRCHSGMGLGRRGKSVYDKSRGNLEYRDEEGYGGDGEEEVFQVESDGESSKGASIRPSTTNTQDLENDPSSITVQNDAQEIQVHDNVENALNRTPTNGRAKSVLDANLLSNHLPLNPKEAQLAKPDQRVVFFLLLEDLTADMGRPCVLDLKMGTRQYGIEATPKKMESQRRKCKTTTSQQLGVRICGMQTFDVKKQQPAYEDKYFGRDLKAGREFREALTRFLYDGVSYLSVTKRIPTILDKLGKLESMVRRLPGYRFYASSLLMLYDAEPERSQRASNEAVKGKNRGRKNDGEKEKDKDKEKKWPPPIELKIVDFANCVTGEDPLPPNAPCPPFHPGTVDRGYLRGLRTLKMYFQQILRDITESEYVERGDGDATGSDMVGAGGTHGGSEIVTDEDEGEVSI